MIFKTEPKLNEKWNEALEAFNTIGRWAVIRHPGTYTGWYLYRTYREEKRANLRYDLDKTVIKSGAIAVMDPKGIVTDLRKAKDYDRKTVWHGTEKYIKNYKPTMEEVRMNLRKEIRKIINEQLTIDMLMIDLKDELT